MTPFEFLNARASMPAKLLGEPGPTAEQLHALLTLAVRVPDHGKLTPWRFIRVAGPARTALGERLAALTLTRDPAAPAAVVDKDRARFNHAPLVLAVVARLTPGHKVPEQEQLLSAGCVCYNLLLGAQALGLGAQWLTGWPAYDAEVARELGLAEQERVVGFVHIGSARDAAPERPRPDPHALTSDYVG
jgi:nitroreductase